jgi:hypothetical protein
MRLDAQAVHRAAQAPHLTDGMRFTIFRWVELLEPSNHFCVSASSWIDPLTGIRELRNTIEDIRSSGQSRAGEVLERSEALRRILSMHDRVNVWYPDERVALILSLKAAEQGTPRRPRPNEGRVAFESRRQKVAASRFAPIVATELAGLETSLLDPSSGYLQRLLGEVRGWLTQPPASFVDWRRFDHGLTWLAAHAVEHGRDPTSLASRAVQAFEHATSAEQAADDFVAVFGRPQRPYVAAIAVEGVHQIQRVERFGCLPMRGPLAWPTAGPALDARLVQFRDDARSRRAGPACVVLVRCDAWDDGHARQRALARVAQLVDHVCAEHPATDIRLGHSILVLDEQSTELTDASPKLRSLRYARALKPHKELSRSLRFYGLARQESVPVISVLHTWIALEDLAADARKQTRSGPKTQAPGAFLIPHAASLVALACARAQLTSVFSELKILAKKSDEADAWRELEQWLEVKAFGPPIPLPKWLRLVRAVPIGKLPAHAPLAPDASQGAAAAFLWALVSRLGPYASFRVTELSRRLRNGGELGNWVSEIRMLAELHLTRMRFLRHATVHRARHSDDAARQLAIASHDIADAVYEVLPLWLDDENKAWEGLRDARRHLQSLLAHWASHSGHRELDPDHLLHP